MEHGRGLPVPSPGSRPCHPTLGPILSPPRWAQQLATTSSAGDAPLHGPPGPAVSNGRIPVQPAAGRQEGTLLLIADTQCN